MTDAAGDRQSVIEDVLGLQVVLGQLYSRVERSRVDNEEAVVELETLHRAVAKEGGQLKPSEGDVALSQDLAARGVGAPAK